MDDISNDNLTAPDGALTGPDPHGQAAILLVESLIHGLVAKSALSLEEAIEIVDIAADTDAEVATDEGDRPLTSRKSLALLTAIGASLRTDLPED